MTEEQTPRRIMVVEDYDDTRMLLKQGLEMLGYSVLEASNGQEAVDIADREHPDLILMDMGLPILNGWQATHRLKTTAETRSIPIVALTAFVMAEDRRKCLAVGCDAFESKPVNFDRLLRTMQTLLSSSAEAISQATVGY